MNWVNKRRKELELKNYVLKADATFSCLFGLSKKKVNEYKAGFGTGFNIILYGDDNSESDFYTIPYLAISDLLMDENLCSGQGRQRWVGDIRNHVLRIRNSKKEPNLADYFSMPITDKTETAPLLNPEDKNDYAIENAKREVQVRTRQSTFRQKVLSNFQNKCCVTEISELSLLVASHIISWASKVETRLSPYNGLCLSMLYDRLFDLGYFTLDEHCHVIVTKRISSLSPRLQEALLAIAGKPIVAPVLYAINIAFLQYHFEHIFDLFSSG